MGGAERLGTHQWGIYRKMHLQGSACSCSCSRSPPRTTSSTAGSRARELSLDFQDEDGRVFAVSKRLLEQPRHPDRVAPALVPNAAELLLVKLCSGRNDGDTVAEGGRGEGRRKAVWISSQGNAAGRAVPDDSSSGEPRMREGCFFFFSFLQPSQVRFLPPSSPDGCGYGAILNDQVAAEGLLLLSYPARERRESCSQWD